MDQKDKARLFRSLHIKGDPLILHNIWDTCTAGAVAESGAKAIGTSSFAIAAAHGCNDGQSIPMSFVLDIVSHMTRAIAVPVTVDFEGGYASNESELENNVSLLIETGAVGLNFEDQKFGSDELHSPGEQARRISAIRRAAERSGLPLVINARTDVFSSTNRPPGGKSSVDEVILRAQIYEDAGADCFFVPFLEDVELIAHLCERISLPLNVMVSDVDANLVHLANVGVARISFGPTIYLKLMNLLANEITNHQTFSASEPASGKVPA